MSMLALILPVAGVFVSGASETTLSPVVLYVGPDQLLPFTSFIGAAIGILLMFWNRALGIARRAWQLLTRR